METINCIVVGDTGVGKTSFILTYVDRRFPGEYEYTQVVRDELYVNIKVDETLIHLTLLDTMSDSEFDKIRSLSYQNVNTVLICFSLTDPVSFENVRLKWLPEVVFHCPDIPYIIVGTKLDLREDEATIESLQKRGLAPVNLSQGKTLSKETNAVKYLECSCLLQTSIDDAIHEAVRAVLLRKQEKKKTICNLC